MRPPRRSKSSSLANGRILLNDVDNHRLVEHAGSPCEITSVTKYPDSRRTGEIMQEPRGNDQGFRRAAAGTGDTWSSATSLRG